MIWLSSTARSSLTACSSRGQARVVWAVVRTIPINKGLTRTNSSRICQPTALLNSSIEQAQLSCPISRSSITAPRKISHNMLKICSMSLMMDLSRIRLSRTALRKTTSLIRSLSAHTASKRATSFSLSRGAEQETDNSLAAGASSPMKRAWFKGRRAHVQALLLRI